MSVRRLLSSRPHQQQCRSNVRLCCQKWQQCRTSLSENFVLSTKSKHWTCSICFDFVERTNFTIYSFDIVAIFGNKVECCFDIVAGVDGALYSAYYKCNNYRILRYGQTFGRHMSGGDKNSSGDEIANVNFLTTISHTRRPTSKYRKKDKPTSFNKLDDR